MTVSRLLLAAALVASAAAGGAENSAPDAMRGEQVYARCLACHALAYDRVGPRHCGLFGRRAGSVPQFSYSPTMKKSRSDLIAYLKHANDTPECAKHASLNSR